MRASLRALTEAGASHPATFLYGIDVAREARHHGLRLIESGVPASHLISADFFAVDPRRIPPIDLVVGNPPYIRHHWFQDESRESAVAALARQEIRLSGRANAWAYFLVHVGAFLRQGGRMTMLLPGAVCFADYATDALDYVRKHAGRCTLARIGKRLFANAREDTVVLLVEGWGSGPCDLTIEDFESIEDLEFWLRNEPGPPARETSTHACLSARLELEGPAAKAWKRALAAPGVLRLGDLARVRIGAVTGANRFFVQSVKASHRLEAAGARSVPIVARGRLLAGLVWGRRDQRRLEKDGSPSRLILADPDGPLRGALLDWVTAGEDTGLHKRFYCRRRKVWYVLRDHAVPDAFLHYMGKGAPRVVLNSAGSLVTNAVHRVWWQSEAISPEAVAVGTCTSLFALACELYGRKYGGGVLKVEPGAAIRLPIPVIAAAGDKLREIDALLRAKDLPNANALADEIVLVRGLGLSQKAATALRDATTRLALRRRSQERFL